MLFDDGNYQSSETPAQKTSSDLKDKLWQAIDRKKLSYPLVDDTETPGATAEQARRSKLSIKVVNILSSHKAPRVVVLSLYRFLATRRLRMSLSG